MNSRVRFGLLAAMIVAAAVPSGAGADTCETIFGHVTFNGFTIEPESPAVGDEVVVHFDVVPAVYSVVGFELLDADESFQGPTSNTSSAEFHLTAVQAGLAHLTLRVDYWTEMECIGDGPPYFALGPRLTVDSPSYEVPIAPNPEYTPSTPTPTSLPTPTTTANRIPPEAVATARPNPARSGQLVVLDASQSTGGISQATWQQWDPEGPHVDLADCAPSGPCTERWSAYFIAPSVTSETTLHFTVSLASFGGTAGASANVEVAVVPAPSVSATPTPTMTPTATPTPPPCISGCDQNAPLSLGDLLSSIEIALGRAPSSECPALDVDQNQTVTVDELIVGVASLRSGCV